MIVTAIPIGIVLSMLMAVHRWFNAHEHSMRLIANQRAIESAQREANWTLFTNNVQFALANMLFGAGVVVVAGGVVGIGLFAMHRWHKLSLPVDGMFAMQRHKMRMADGGEAIVVINPNNMAGAAGVVHPQLGFVEMPTILDPARQLDLRKTVQATATMQAMRDGVGGNHNQAFYRNAAGEFAEKARLLAAKADNYINGRQPLTATDGEQAAPPVQLLALPDALAQSQPDRFLLGQNHESGKLIAFNPFEQQNIGIVGATGTGKTAGTGYHLLLLALKFGYHPLILDPKGGVDLRPFALHGEWRPTNADMFGGQIEQVRLEHDRRMEIIQRHQVANVDELRSNEMRHILVFVEEYGALWEDIERTKKRGEADAINSDIDTMMRLSRATGIHWCFVDQFPEKWSKQVFMATKMRLVYQVAPGQDAYLHEYKAAELPDRGAFMYRRTEYANWDVKPQLRNYLAELPMSDYPELIDVKPTASVPKSVPGIVPNGVPSAVPDRSTSVYPPPPVTVPVSTVDGNEAHKWADFVDQWNASNPDGGPSALARAMADADGNIKPYTDYKSEAARRLDALRVKGSNSIADQLRAQGVDLSDVRLPGGEKIGVDVTTERKL